MRHRSRRNLGKDAQHLTRRNPGFLANKGESIMSNKVSITQAKRMIIELAGKTRKNGKTYSILLEGPPGIAKTAIVRQAADFLGRTMCEIILSQKAPEHITGYPFLDKVTDAVRKVTRTVMSYAAPDWWPTEEGSFMFLDEVGQCPIAVQNVGMQIVEEYRCGPNVCPPGTIVIGATNAAEHRAGSTAMTTTLRSRWDLVVEVVPTKEEWLEHAKANNFNKLLVAAVESQFPEVVDFDPKRKGGFVTLRTLEQASDLLNVWGSDPDNPDLAAALHGCLGDSAASTVLAFAQSLNELPTYDDIRDNPMTAPAPEQHVAAVAAMLQGHARYVHAGALVRYITRYSEESQARLVLALPENVATHPEVEALRESLKMD
jgi:hypothetical protein